MNPYNQLTTTMLLKGAFKKFMLTQISVYRNWANGQTYPDSLFPNSYFFGHLLQHFMNSIIIDRT